MSASDGRSWVLGHSETQRLGVGSLVAACPPGWVVRVEPPRRSVLQNRLLHALLGDLAEQLIWPQPPANDGMLHDVEWWKRRCTLQWLIDQKQPVEIITPLMQVSDAEDFGLLLPHTSDLKTSECASLSEWIIAFGAQNGVQFKEKTA